MIKRIVISRGNIPSQFPIGATWLVALSQSVWNIPGWLLGILWFGIVILWLLILIDIFTADRRDLFKDDKIK